MSNRQTARTNRHQKNKAQRSAQTCHRRFDSGFGPGFGSRFRVSFFLRWLLLTLHLAFAVAPPSLANSGQSFGDLNPQISDLCHQDNQTPTDNQDSKNSKDSKDGQGATHSERCCACLACDFAPPLTLWRSEQLNQHRQWSFLLHRLPTAQPHRGGAGVLCPESRAPPPV